MIIGVKRPISHRKKEITMNDTDKRKDFDQRKKEEPAFCNKPFNAESSRLTDEDNPCDVVQEK